MEIYPIQSNTLKRFGSQQGAAAYAAKFESQWVERIRNGHEQRLVNDFLSMIPASDFSGFVLDMPCGFGRFLPSLREFAPRVVEGDWSGSMLEIVRFRHPGMAPEMVRSSATTLPFASRSFSLVFSVRLCHHIQTFEQRLEYLREIQRVSERWIIFTYLDEHSCHNAVRSRLRRWKGKRATWGMSADEVAGVFASGGFQVVRTELLSKLLSSQRYTLLRRNGR